MAIKDIKVVETIKEGSTIYPVADGADKPLAILPKDSTKTYSWHTEACDMAGVNQAAYKEWTLTALNGTEIVAEKPLTMKFEHGRVSVFGGINRLTGSYALVGNVVVKGGPAQYENGR
jgi:heat shock protein HslJ